MTESSWQELQEKLQLTFFDTSLLIQACTHPSFVNASTPDKEHNERLAFLGDAVLNLCVKRHLYHNFTASKGTMTEWCSALTSNQALAEVTDALEIMPYLLKKRSGEKSDTLRQAADLFEALIGAIYIDRGYDEAAKFIARHIFPRLPQLVKEKIPFDPRGRLQELVQRRHGVIPCYKILTQSRPKHDQLYVAEVFVNKKSWGRGSGKNKQTARKNAAKAALEQRFSHIFGAPQDT